MVTFPHRSFRFKKCVVLYKLIFKTHLQVVKNNNLMLFFFWKCCIQGFSTVALTFITTFSETVAHFCRNYVNESTPHSEDKHSSWKDLCVLCKAPHKRKSGPPHCMGLAVQHVWRKNSFRCDGWCCIEMLFFRLGLCHSWGAGYFPWFTDWRLHWKGLSFTSFLRQHKQLRDELGLVIHWQ